MIATNQNMNKYDPDEIDLILDNYKMLTELIPELEGLVFSGMVTSEIAKAVIDYMQPDDRETLIKSLKSSAKVQQDEPYSVKTLSRWMSQLQDHMTDGKLSLDKYRQCINEEHPSEDFYNRLDETVGIVGQWCEGIGILLNQRR